MSVFEIISSVILLVASIVLIVIVLAQQGKDNYLGGAIAGGAAESFLGRNKAQTIETFLTKLTRGVSIAVVVLIILVNIATIYKK